MGAGDGGLGGTCTLTPFGKASPTEMAIPRANTDESARERDAARMPRPRDRDAVRSMPLSALRGGDRQPPYPREKTKVDARFYFK